MHVLKPRTLSDNVSVFELHEYIEFRYLTVQLPTSSDALSNAAALTLAAGAWQVRYPWNETDSSFNRCGSPEKGERAS